MEESKLCAGRTAAGIPREAISILFSSGQNWLDRHPVRGRCQPAGACMIRQAWDAHEADALRACSQWLLPDKALGELGRELNNGRLFTNWGELPGSACPAPRTSLCHAASAFYASAFDRALVLRSTSRVMVMLGASRHGRRKAPA